MDTLTTCQHDGAHVCLALGQHVEQRQDDTDTAEMEPTRNEFPNGTAVEIGPVFEIVESSHVRERQTVRLIDDDGRPYQSLTGRPDEARRAFEVWTNELSDLMS